MRLRRLGWLLLLWFAAALHADEAVDRDGKRRLGELSNGHFLEQSTGKKLPLADLRSVRFAPQPTPLAKVPPSFRVHLRSGDQVSGQVLRGDAKQFPFLTAFGTKQTFDRSEVVGVEQLDGFRRVFAESFEGDWKAWKAEGSPRLDDRTAMLGTKSLRFDKPGQSVQREWKPAFDRGRISLYFHDGAGELPLGWQLDLQVDEKKPNWLPCFRATDTDYATPEGWRRRHALPRRVGWHLLQIDLTGGRCQVFVDDLLLGELVDEAPMRATGMRLQTSGGKAGDWHFDQVEVAERGLPSARLEPSAESDALLLPGDARFFGAFERADEQEVVFAAKSFTWRQVHGFTFKGGIREVPKLPVEVRFRPGPGVSPDRMFGTSIRFDDGVFVLSHSIFGEVRLLRGCLEQLLLHDKK
jgi:hypothetical protein